MSKKINACFRGGGAMALGYSPVNKEIEEKNIKFGILSGTSAGSINAALLAVGKSYKDQKHFYKSFPGDKTMRREDRLEGNVGIFTKMILGISVFLGGRRKIYPVLRKIFKDNFSWERVKIANRADKVFICFFPKEIMGSVHGAVGLLGVRDIRAYTSTDPEEFENLKSFSYPFYLSDDGIYAFIGGHEDKGLTKISDTVIPLDLAVLASFHNPVFRNIKLKFKIRSLYKRYFSKKLKNRKKWTCFDGGVVDNHAVLAQPFDKKFHCFICDSFYPGIKKEDWGGKMISDYNFNLNRPAKKYIHLCPPKEDRSFFEFTNEAVEHEFDGRKSNFT